jgi:hypothetical protein
MTFPETETELAVEVLLNEACIISSSFYVALIIALSTSYILF